MTQTGAKILHGLTRTSSDLLLQGQLSRSLLPGSIGALAALPTESVPSHSPRPFCSKSGVHQGSLVFEEFIPKHQRKSLAAITHGRLGGVKVGLYTQGSLLYARIGHEQALVSGCANRFDYERGPLRFIATSAQGSLFGCFVLNDGHNLYTHLAFAVSRDKQGQLYGEDRTGDFETKRWVFGAFGVWTPNVLWPVTKGTFNQEQQRYFTFREASALYGCRTENIPAQACTDSHTIELLRVVKSTCAAGYPEEALVIRIANANIGVPVQNTFLAGWVGTQSVYIGREGDHLAVALYTSQGVGKPSQQTSAVFDITAALPQHAPLADLRAPALPVLD
jgi:hypothetical protein